MSEKRYTYRLRSVDRRIASGRVISTYAAKSPATSALYGHISFILQKEVGWRTWCAKTNAERKKLSKEIAARDYELVTYVLVEESRLESLEEDSAWLGHLENAGVDNWSGISFAYDLKREAEGEDEDG